MPSMQSGFFKRLNIGMALWTASPWKEEQVTSLKSTYYQLRSFSEGAILCLLLLLIDLGLTIPTEVQMRRFSSIHEHQQEDTTRKTEGQMTRLGSNNELQKEGTLRKTNNSGRQHDSRQSDFILKNL